MGLSLLFKFEWSNISLPNMRMKFLTILHLTDFTGIRNQFRRDPGLKRRIIF
jgi:hypothetical protein